MRKHQELLLLPVVLLLASTKPYANAKQLVIKGEENHTYSQETTAISTTNQTNETGHAESPKTEQTHTADVDTEPPKPAEPKKDYLPLLPSDTTTITQEIPAGSIEDDWPQPARLAGKAYRYLLHQKLDIGVRTTSHKLDETERGEPFDGSFIGSIDQLRLLPEESPSYFLVFRYAPIPYVGVGYQTDELVIRTQTSIPRERRVDDRDTDGNLIMQARMPFVFVRYNILNWIEPYAEYGRARYTNTFDPDPRWFAEGRREFVVEDSKASYWSFGLGITIGKHVVLDVYTRSIKTDVDAIYYFRGDSRDPEPFVFPASHRTHGFTASVRF